MIRRPEATASRGVTLIELIIVMAVMGILLTLAVPGYRSYSLRVHRSEAIRLLLQASVCQERIHAVSGSYDTGMCQLVSEQHRYRISYQAPVGKGHTFIAMATPMGAQRSDPCGRLALDQDGVRSISTEIPGNINIETDTTSTVKCWNGR